MTRAGFRGNLAREKPIKSVMTIIQRAKTDNITGHSLMMVLFATLANFFIYLYHLTMGILLEPEQYGILFSLISLLNIVLVFCQAISTTMSRFVSKLGVESNPSGINYLWRSGVKKAALLGVIVFTSFVVLSPLLSRFLGINNLSYFIILFSTTLMAFVFAVNAGTLNGLQRFWHLGTTQVLENFLVATVGGLLVYLGFGLYGGFVAFPLAYFTVLVLTFYFLRDVRRIRSEQARIAGLPSYIGLALTAILAISTLTNIDVVLVKHYLNAADAGSYSAISVLGRVIFYAPIGIATAMFPKTAALFESGGAHRRVFQRAVLLALVTSGSAVTIYRLFPQFIVQFLFGNRYPQVAPYLFRYGLAMALFGISFIAMRYFLSINQTRVAYALIFTTGLQLVLIAFAHSDISQVINVMLLTSITGVISMVPFYLTAGKSNSNPDEAVHR